MGPESYLGSVNQFAGNFAPRGWARCDGQLVSIQQHTAVFAILGTMYGGDGIQTFALPKMNNSTEPYQTEPIWCICMEGIFPPRD